MKLNKSENNLPFIVTAIKIHGVVRLQDNKVLLHEIEAPNGDEMFFHITLCTDLNVGNWNRYETKNDRFQIITNLEDYYPVVWSYWLSRSL